VGLIKKGYLNLLNLGEVPSDKHQEYIDQIKYEVEVIKNKGMIDYFLSTQEIINDIIKEEGTRNARGVGRGSCCGSLVAYCIGITGVDPIKHDLSFARFLSGNRGGKIMELEVD